MSLLILPDEILNLVLSYYAPQFSNSRSFGYRSTRAILHDAFEGVVNLSSTCSTLRQLCGGLIFLFVSLVRRSEVDSILACPRRMDRWSKAVEYGEVFARIANLPSQSNSPHKVVEPSRKSSILSFVTDLEITNRSLSNGDLHSFPHLKHLHILDVPMLQNQRFDLPKELSLESLSLNLETLMCSSALIDAASRCLRLDLLCDLAFCNPDKSFDRLHLACNLGNLREVNLFFSSSFALRCKCVLSYLHEILQGPLQRLSLRVFQKTSGQEGPSSNQELEDPIESGEELMSYLSNSLNLNDFTIDLEILSRLGMGQHNKLVPQNRTRHRDISITLVIHSLNFSKLLHGPREFTVGLIRVMLANVVKLAYGEVVDQAHLHCLSVARDLVLLLVTGSDIHSPYLKIEKVLLEKAWSIPDDSLLRLHYEGLIESFNNQRNEESEQAILQISLTSIPPLASSRYRQRETFTVAINGDHTESWPMVECGLPHRNDPFWSMETSMSDLEHYSARERILLSLWD